MSLISALLFIVILLEMFYSRRPFGRSWDDDTVPVHCPKLFVNKVSTKVLDAPLPYQMGFQDPASSSMEGIIDLHHEILFYLIITISFVLWMLVRIVVLFHTNTPGQRHPDINITHHSGLE